MKYDSTPTSTNIAQRRVALPAWLDNLIYNELSATYCRMNKDLVVLDWGHNDILSYLGTYFPRSFAESYCIFSSFFGNNKMQYQDKTELSVFDFGCGTGGELIGFILAVSEQLPSVSMIDVKALDGNIHALRLLESILHGVGKHLSVDINYNLAPIVIDDFYDMSIVTYVIKQKYDFIISFKAICEFVTKQQFEDKNPYEHIINVFLPKMKSHGIICLADVTSYNKVSNDWLPKMLDRASAACNVEILCRNNGFNEEYRVTHSHQSNDVSKLAWRIYKLNN